MKKKLYILLITAIFSCSGDSGTNNVSFDDIKYFTRNSVQVGTLIKSELKTKHVLILSYPEYAVESYQLIKFIASIIKKEGSLTVIMPGHPDKNKQILINRIRNQAPILGFNEYIELNEYLEKLDITINGTIEINEEVILILAPEHDYEKIEKQTLDFIHKDQLIKIVLAGTKFNKKENHIIKKLPKIKKISSIPLKGNRFNIMILLGEVQDYTPVTPIKLFNMDNYLDAPESFIQENKSIFKSIHINRMNNYLPELIKKSFDELGEKR